MQKLIDLIENSNANQMQKNVMKGFVNRSGELADKRKGDFALIEILDKYNTPLKVVLSTDDVIIYTVTGKDDEWNIKYPYRVIYKNDNGNWHKVDTVSPTFDIAYLNYLERKYIGGNSQFADFAMKMLGIKIEE